MNIILYFKRYNILYIIIRFKNKILIMKWIILYISNEI